MDKKICVKCGKELPSDHSDKICEECKVKKNKLVKNIVIGGTTIVSVVAGCVFLKSRPNILADLSKSFKKFPVKPSADVAQLGTQVGNAVKSESKNWMSKTDMLKLDNALAEGLVTKGMIQSCKFEFEKGLMLVDDFLKMWSADIVSSKFPSWREKVKDIPVAKFVDILNDAGEEIPQVVDVKFLGDIAQVTFKSKAGKTNWNAFFNFFNDAGELTANCVCNAPYDNANVLRDFICSVVKRLKDFVEE